MPYFCCFTAAKSRTDTKELFETRLPITGYLDDAARLLDGGPIEGELRQRLDAEMQGVDRAIGRLVEAIADGVLRVSHWDRALSA